MKIESTSANNWWKKDPIYEIYIRSFFDANGDGTGDLKESYWRQDNEEQFYISFVGFGSLGKKLCIRVKEIKSLSKVAPLEGISRKLDYLKWLGIKNLWITPFFKSPMIDNGYDISDYYDIDPLFGDFDDFKALVQKARSHGTNITFVNVEFLTPGMHLILDMVLNHTSDEHPWFLASVKREAPYEDYYIWHDGKVNPHTGTREPPNNWQSCFGGSAWSFNDDRQQFYLHTFHCKQPNLNCRSQIVVGEFFNILKFWIDHGVDGFRIDAVKHLIYDEQFRDNVVGDCGRVMCRYDWEQPELFDFVRKIRDFTKNYGRMSYDREILVVTEAYTDLNNMKKYYENSRVDMPFNFCLIGWQKSSNNATYLGRIIQETVDLCREMQSWPNWVLGNHDTNRITSRLAGEICPAMTDLANMLLLCLPGTPTCYYGDELGMCDVDVPYHKQKDIRGIKLGPDDYKQRSRDPFRSPMVWNDARSLNCGFSLFDKVEPWLPMPRNYGNFAVNSQKSDNKSHLQFFRRLLDLRSSRPVLSGQGRNIIFPDFDSLYDRRSNDILIFVRTSSQNFVENNLLIILYLDDSNEAVNTDSKVCLDLSILTQILNIDYNTRILLTTPNVTDLCDDQIVDLRSVIISKHEVMEWWKTGPIYEVYIRSFKDSNEDGIGDLRGVIEKIPYLKFLGVKGIWVTPFFQSGGVDHGYDIINHCEIDPKFGDIDDFRELIDKARQCDIHVIIDVIANHTSDQCVWFKDSIKRVDPHTDFYIWRDGKIDPETGGRLPPTNWASRFGGSAWTFDTTRKQYYMHTFHCQQPNLNCRNRQVMEEILKIVKFWLDLGVDGFRFDAVKHMICDAEYRDNETEEFYFSFKGKMHIKANQRFDYDQPEVFPVLRIITDYVKKQSRLRNRHILVMTEAYTSPENTRRYFTEAGADMPFNFCLTQWSWETSTARDLRQMINQTIMIGHEKSFWLNWVVGNHDRSRIGSRLKADSNGAVVDLSNMLMFLLPGTPIFYYGEELGMMDSEISFEECVDEVGKKLGPEEYHKRTRDPCRAPLPWTCETPNAGFTSTNLKPWLALPRNFKDICVENQERNPKSHLNFFRELNTFVGKNFRVCDFDGSCDSLTLLTIDSSDNILAFTRNSKRDGRILAEFLVILHLGGKKDDGAQNDNSFEVLDLLNVADLKEKMKNGGICGKVVLKTPKVHCLEIDDCIYLNNIKIRPFDGLVLQLI